MPESFGENPEPIRVAKVEQAYEREARINRGEFKSPREQAQVVSSELIREKNRDLLALRLREKKYEQDPNLSDHGKKQIREKRIAAQRKVQDETYARVAEAVEAMDLKPMTVTTLTGFTYRRPILPEEYSADDINHVDGQPINRQKQLPDGRVAIVPDNRVPKQVEVHPVPIIDSKGNEWYLLKGPGVEERYVLTGMDSTREYATVTTTLNLRQFPGTENPVERTLEPGEKLIIEPFYHNDGEYTWARVIDEESGLPLGFVAMGKGDREYVERNGLVNPHYFENPGDYEEEKPARKFLALNTHYEPKLDDDNS